MRIAQVAPLYEAVPPRLYGGTERVVGHLADALVELGHEVTLFASAETITKAKLISCRDQALRLDSALKSDLAAHIVMLEQVREKAHQFDIVHFHIDLLQMPLFRDMAERTVTTLHGRLDIKDLPPFYARFPEFPLVSISNDQRRALPGVTWAGTVYHGLPADLYCPTPRPSADYVVFLGRISPEKRPDQAIAIAKRAGMKLKIAAKVDPVDRDYFKFEIEPLLDHPLVEYVGEINDADKCELLGNAAALLFPIDWPEPFGLVMIEAMACGTPVIARRCGSVAEVLEHGLTGFIFDDLEDASEALYKLDQLDRGAIRTRFEQLFTSHRMARSYLTLYRSLIWAAERLEQRRRVPAGHGPLLPVAAAEVGTVNAA